MRFTWDASASEAALSVSCLIFCSTAALLPVQLHLMAVWVSHMTSGSTCVFQRGYYTLNFKLWTCVFLTLKSTIQTLKLRVSHMTSGSTCVSQKRVLHIVFQTLNLCISNFEIYHSNIKIEGITHDLWVHLCISKRVLHIVFQTLNFEPVYFKLWNSSFKLWNWGVSHMTSGSTCVFQRGYYTLYFKFWTCVGISNFEIHHSNFENKGITHDLWVHLCNSKMWPRRRWLTRMSKRWGMAAFGMSHMTRVGQNHV